MDPRVTEFHRYLDEEVRRLVNAARAIDEDRARRLIIERLPRTGAWFVRHPRALRLLFRVRPSLRPTLFYVHGSITAV